jgi:hypothetical protein
VVKKLQLNKNIVFIINQHSDLFSQTYKKYFSENTKKTLNSLKNAEILYDGISWPRSGISSAKYTALEEGYDRIGKSFKVLCKSTELTEYLNKYKKSINYVYVIKRWVS